MELRPPIAVSEFSSFGPSQAMLRHQIAKMSSTLPPLTKLVESKMEKLYPLALADKSWDNVGLLLDPPTPRPRDPALPPSVLLTIDLTTTVAKEALAERSGIETIVSYRMLVWLRC